jgi:hypothetical protein
LIVCFVDLVGRQQPLSEEGNKSNISLLAQLEKLQILSSDEEDDIVDVETIEEEAEYNSPTKSVPTDDVYVDSVLKTPGAVVAKMGIIKKGNIKKENIATNAVAANKKLKLKNPSSSRPPLPPVKSNQYVSVAEAIQKFQKNTPDRFRSIPRFQTVAPGQKTSGPPLRTTIPQPFKLSTAKPRPVVSYSLIKNEIHFS